MLLWWSVTYFLILEGEFVYAQITSNTQLRLNVKVFPVISVIFFPLISLILLIGTRVL